MRALKQVLKKKLVEFDIQGFTLLSTDEYSEFRDIIPNVHETWWLRSPGDYESDAAVVEYDSSISSMPVNMIYGFVRPAILIESQASDLEAGDKIELAGKVWTALSDQLLLCDELVGRTCFREDIEAEDASSYEASDIKRWLESWAEDAFNQKPTEPLELNITGVTLLSAEEYDANKELVSILDGLWWLRSPGYYPQRAAAMLMDGTRYDYSVEAGYVCVRPALTGDFKSKSKSAGESFKLAGYTWTVLTDKLALCDDFVGQTCFRNERRAADANSYEASDIKRWLENWAKENRIMG